MRELQGIYVEWLDARQSDGAWKTVDEVEEYIANHNISTVRQIGFLYRDTEEFIVIVDGIVGGAGEELEFGMVQLIPNTWIRKRQEMPVSIFV